MTIAAAWSSPNSQPFAFPQFCQLFACST
ncbi:hypothetical protein RDI58_019393 [Solanum bulbocastanum]|uniref:Uncharacterized protein n=1 Tax=Solanum bulbocastanum TaxID=147425 RepID=A0AAN8TAT9_SOLBU